MRPEVAHRRIEAFGKRFGEAHLYLAYHAAFPLALTPDLLYRLWANFQRDIHGEVLNIPWIAVADLLLSSFCDEVGHELYEMEGAVRNALLSELKANPRFGTERINELSDFLLAYIQQQLDSPDIDTRDFAQAQKWTALAYVRPNEAARDIASALKSAYQQDRAELVRMASLVETFAEPLAQFNPLLVYARGMGNLARGDWKGAAVQFDAARGQRREVRIAGISLPIPEQILVKTSQSPTPESNSSRVGSLRASKQGLEIVDRARKKKGWNKGSSAWIDATGTISRSTLQRFWRRQPIRQENFIAICKAVGIDDWEKILDDSSIQETSRSDWSEAPDVSTFYGRNEELTTLEQWIVRERCRLLALLGRAGIGKTSLCVKLAEQIQDQFEYVIWRALLNNPPLQEVLADLIKFLSDQQETDLPETLDGSISRLISYFQKQRCFLVLDDPNPAMHGSKEFGYLLRKVGETRHQSCLVLVSRHKPREIELLEEAKLPVRSLELTGWSNPRSSGRSLIASPQGIEKAKLALVRRNLTQKALTNERGIASWSTVSKFFKGKPVNRSIFIEICEELGLDWTKIISTEKISINRSSGQKILVNGYVRSLQVSLEGIKEARNALMNKNWNQKVLAENLEISQSTVGKFFRGQRVERKYFLEICKELNLDWEKIGIQPQGVAPHFRTIPTKRTPHFSTLRTKITDAEILKASLCELGITVRTDADVRSSNGTRVRTDIVAVLEGKCDLGWSRNSDGTFDLIADLQGIAERYNQTELINSINRMYAATLLREYPEDSKLRKNYLGMVEATGTPEEQQEAIAQTTAWLQEHLQDSEIRKQYLLLIDKYGTEQQKQEAIHQTTMWLQMNPQDSEIRKQYLLLIDKYGTEQQKQEAIALGHRV